MKLKELRKKHPFFVYQDFNIQKQGKRLKITYDFRLASDIQFKPDVTIPLPQKGIEPEKFSNFAFHLGLIEAVSYWKSSCSPNFIVKAGNLTDSQISWWHDLFINGLGEFFYRNNIDFTKNSFLKIHTLKNAPVFKLLKNGKKKGDLIMVGGGKDSIVTLNCLKAKKGLRNILLLNPTIAALKTSEIAGYNKPIIVNRTIDKKLLELNEQGYLNGHTPFSAYLSFLGIFAAAIYGFKHIISSNEQSAEEGNIKFHGIEINHQYSKSLRFERLFRKYSKKYLSEDISYFSFLRPLYELQAAALFAQTKRYDKAFGSCNISRNKYFCGDCPKCAFVYLSLIPFLSHSRIKKIFGGNDYFNEPKIQKHIIDLVGLGKHKPFDCVGTKEESIFAILLAEDKYKQEKENVPKFLLNIKDRLKLNKQYSAEEIKNKLRTDWNSNNFLPKKYETLLKKQLAKIKI